MYIDCKDLCGIFLLYLVYYYYDFFILNYVKYFYNKNYSKSNILFLKQNMTIFFLKKNIHIFDDFTLIIALNNLLMLSITIMFGKLHIFCRFLLGFCKWACRTPWA